MSIETTDGRTWFDHESNTVYWNPDSGFETSQGTMSAALGLAHELIHAVEFHIVGQVTFESNLHVPMTSEFFHMSDGSMKVVFNMGISIEEARATAVESIIAGQLGEPIRNNYNDGHSRRVSTPIFSCFKGEVGC